eukprot:scaffold314223_cov35-Tisochrysis_lutea.AAC.2
MAVLVDLSLEWPRRVVGIEIGPAVALAQVREDRRRLRDARLPVFEERDVARRVKLEKVFRASAALA